jgi:hypothetical protein
MAKGKTTLRGRFPKGTIVSLREVPDAGTLRSTPEQEVDTKTVNDDGEVTFSTDVGTRYIAFAYVNGAPLEVRVTGRETDDPNALMTQPPIGPDRIRLSDGSFSDEEPKRVAKDDLPMEAAPELSQQMVPRGTRQRSDTPRGTAHPVDTDEPAPYEAQENVADDVKQMSDTETGAAARIAVGPQRQEDVPAGVWREGSGDEGELAGEGDARRAGPRGRGAAAYRYGRRGRQRAEHAAGADASGDEDRGHGERAEPHGP